MGRFQLWTFLWLCLPAFFPGIVILSLTFTGATPNHRCLVKGCDDNATNSFPASSFVYHTNETNLFNQDDIRIAQCFRYNTQGCQLNKTKTNSTFLEKCDRWIYDTSIFHSTVVGDFDLVCDDEWKQTIASSLFMAGMLVGAATIGVIGDLIGRKKTFTLNVFALACVTTASAFSQDWVTFCAMRFLSGIGACGHFLIVFVWGVEAVGKKYRVVCGFVYQIMFALGSSSLGLVAFFIRDWRILQLVISTPMFILIALYWILPESIRWLITKKKFSEARKLVLQASNVNGTHFPIKILNSFGENSNNKIGNVSTICINQEKIIRRVSEGPNIPEAEENLLDIFRSKIMMRRLIIMFMAWISGVMGYYGITYSTTHLMGNFYINYELSILIEIPAYLLGMFVVEKIGRRPMLCGGLVISGLGCLVTGLVPTNWTIIKTSSSLVGKLFIACVMATLYSYTSELFPTSSRSAVVGLCSTSGRVGGVLAPVISDWGKKTDKSVPFIVFAAVNISVGVLCLLLPETKGISLPATVDEASKLDKNSLLCLRNWGLIARGGKCEPTTGNQASQLELTRHL